MTASVKNEPSLSVSSPSSKNTANSSHDVSSTVTSREVAISSCPPESSSWPVFSATSSMSSVQPVSSEQETEPSFPTEILEIRLPTIPEGYVLDYEEKTEFLYYAEYVNAENDFFSFEQYIIQSNKITIDTEDVVPIKIKVNEFEAVYYENKGFGNIIWSDGIYGYTLIGLPNQEFLSMIAQTC